MEENWARQFVKGRSKNPKIETLAGLARALGVPVNEFLMPEAEAGTARERPVTINLPVLMPSADILEEAFRAALMGVDPKEGGWGSLAQELAAHFPSALQGALFRQGQRLPPSAPARPSPSPPKRDSK